MIEAIKKEIPKDRLAKSKVKRSQIRIALMDRDGIECWFCGDVLGCYATIEHLIARSNGGPDTLENMVLAHERCNQIASNRSLSAKIMLRDVMRRRS